MKNMEKIIAIHSVWSYNYGSTTINGDHNIDEILKISNERIIENFKKDLSIFDQIKLYKRNLDKYHMKVYGTKNVCIGTSCKNHLNEEEAIDYAINVASLVKFKAIPNDDYNGYMYITEMTDSEIVKMETSKAFKDMNYIIL